MTKPCGTNVIDLGEHLNQFEANGLDMSKPRAYLESLVSVDDERQQREMMDEFKNGNRGNKSEAALAILLTVTVLESLRRQIILAKKRYEEIVKHPVTGDCEACGHELDERGLERAREYSIDSIRSQSSLVNELIVRYRLVERDLQKLEEELGGVMESDRRTVDLNKLEQLLDFPQDFFLRLLDKKRTASATANSESGPIN